MPARIFSGVISTLLNSVFSPLIGRGRRVAASLGPLIISGTAGAATLGQAYSFVPTVSGGAGTKTFGFSGTTLPSDLGGTFDPATGTISGPFKVQGVINGNITVTDASGSTSLPVSFSATDSAANSAYAFVRTGVQINKPPLMVSPTSDDGPYYPWIVDMSAVPSFPYKWACFFSTDHSDSNNNNGIYLYLTNAANPAAAGTAWTSYDDAYSAGQFSYLPSGAPTANPIVKRWDLSDAQVETPCVNVVAFAGAQVSTTSGSTSASVTTAPTSGGFYKGQTVVGAGIPAGTTIAAISGATLTLSAAATATATGVALSGAVVVMTVQQQQNTGGQGQQSSMRTTSANGIVYPNPVLCLDVAPNQALGDGHTGYFQWATNPFPGLVNPATGVPYKWVGYSLCGGQGRGECAQWVTDDPVTGAWTITTQLQFPYGRVSDALGGGYFVSFNAVDPRTVKQVPQGYSMLTSTSTPGYGDQPRFATLVEVVLDANGQKILAKPNLILGRGASGLFDANEAQQPSVVTLADGSYALVYQGTNASNQNAVGGATSPARSLSAVSFSPLSPAEPATAARRRFDFTALSAQPSLLTLVSAGGTAPTVAYSSSGAAFSVDGTASPIGEAYLFDGEGFVPGDCEMVEFRVAALSSQSSTAYRLPFVGMAASKATPSGQTDMIWLTNLSDAQVAATTGNDKKWCAMNYRQAGTDTLAISARFNGFGYGVDSQYRPYVVAPKTIGFRWFPQAKRLFLLGMDGLNDMEELVLPTSWDMTKRLYPFVGVQSVSGYTDTELVKRMTVHVTPLAKALRDLSSTGLQFTGGAAAGTVIGQIENRYIGSALTFDNPKVSVDALGLNFVVGSTATGTGADETLTVNVTEALGGLASHTTTLTFTSKAPAVPEAETTAYLNRLSGSYTTTQKDAINSFVKQGKTDGWWAKCDAIVCMAMANQADALLNMKGTSFVPTLIGTPTFTAAKGFQGDGSTSKINTNYNPTTANASVTADNFHMSVYSLTNKAESAGMMGSTRDLIGPFNASRFYGQMATSTSSYYADSNSLGNYTMSKAASGIIRWYKDGTALGTKSLTENTHTNEAIHVLGVNGSTQAYSTRQGAFYNLGQDLTDAMVASMATARANLLKALGAI